MSKPRKPSPTRRLRAERAVIYNGGMESLHALLQHLVDYAGLFPPASLPLAPALQNYAAYQASAQAWMLGRFVCPTSQLSEANAHMDWFSPETPLRVAALGRPSANPAEFGAHWLVSLRELQTFCQRHGPRVSVDVLEAPLPPHLTAPSAHDLLERALGTIAHFSPTPLRLFFEIPAAEDWHAQAQRALEALARYPSELGFKLRTGGVVASAFPSVEQVAWAIAACRAHGVALKCTAGLHHPVRHFNQSVQTKMHGFLNVFGAGVLAHALTLPLAEIESILAEEDPAQLVCDADGFAWQHHRVTPAQITAARHALMIAFGSCSFDDPRDDLRALDWL